jgi:cyclohexanone monooxygenase
MGCKRQVVDIGYYEAFNRDNVSLIDLREDPIERINESGVCTVGGQHDVDVLIYATGFDAMTGAINNVSITGRSGTKLKDKWENGPRSYLGLQIAGFPNLFTVTGPGSPSVLSNMLVSIEQHCDWITDCIHHLNSNGLNTIEAEQQAEDQWVKHVFEVADGTMLTAPSCSSWYLGVNIPGKPRVFMPYVGGVGNYRAKCSSVAANGYEGFKLG